MTKKQTLSNFNKEMKPHIIKTFGANDKVALRTAWKDYIDMLYKERKITTKQYNSWKNPFKEHVKVEQFADYTNIKTGLTQFVEHFLTGKTMYINIRDPFVGLLIKTFPENHAVWKFVKPFLR